MTDQPVGRDPHRYQPEDQFQQNPAPQATNVVSAQSAPLAEPMPVQAPLDTNSAPDATTKAPPEANTQQQPASDSTPPTSQDFLDEFPNPDKEMIIVTWDALSRPYKKRQSQYYLTIGAMVFLISIILFFLRQFLPIAVIIAIAFWKYVIEVVPPQKVRHSLTTYGLRVEGKLYEWDELGRFWFTEKHGYQMLNLETFVFPYRVTILLGDIEKEAIGYDLEQVLVNEQPPLTPIEKLGAWLERTLPLESPTPKA
jgi:hypothetical protein